MLVVQNLYKPACERILFETVMFNSLTDAAHGTNIKITPFFWEDSVHLKSLISLLVLTVIEILFISQLQQEFNKGPAARHIVIKTLLKYSQNQELFFGGNHFLQSDGSKANGKT